MVRINTTQTGQNIKRMRKDTGLTIRQMQETFGFGTPQAIYRWMRGETLPSIDNLVILADMFHTTIDDIIAVENGEGHGRNSA